LNESSGDPIDNAECNITFDDATGPFTMTWNGTGDDNYNYTKSAGFVVADLHEWNVTCIKTGIPTLSGTDDVQVNDPPPPLTPAQVPEFSDYALILLIMVVVGGFFFMRRRQ